MDTRIYIVWHSGIGFVQAQPIYWHSYIGIDTNDSIMINPNFRTDEISSAKIDSYIEMREIDYHLSFPNVTKREIVNPH